MGALVLCVAVVCAALIPGDTAGTVGSELVIAAEGAPSSSAGTVDAEVLAASACVAWVEVSGSDRGEGTEDRPWRTLTRAIEEVPDEGCTIVVGPGDYDEGVHVDRRFEHPLTVRAAVDHRSVLVSSGTVLKLNGARNISFEGFRIRHAGPGSTGYLVIADDANGNWSEQLTFRNNIIHDCYENDLMKLYSGVRDVLVEGNVFYNQGPREQHLDLNSAVDVVVRENIFFNDFTRSGRVHQDSKAFVAVKDSGGDEDGNVGARNVVIERNVFANWEGGKESFIQVGNDGRPYHEATDVRIESNLFLGGSAVPAMAPLAVRGARDVVFNGNTVVGDLPAAAAALWFDTTGENPPNEGVVLINNIWSDPTGSMSLFTRGRRSTGDSLVLVGNLYWNGHQDLPSGDVTSPALDSSRVVADPRLWRDRRPVRVPYWAGTAFLSGNTSIRDEHARLVEAHGALDAVSPAIDAADPATAPTTDIQGRPRGGSPDLGAYEAP